MYGTQLALALFMSVSGVSAFMAPSVPVASRAVHLAMADKKSSAFDPLAGDNAPLILNNAGKAWVPQRVRPRRNRKVRF